MENVSNKISQREKNVLRFLNVSQTFTNRSSKHRSYKKWVWTLSNSIWARRYVLLKLGGLGPKSEISCQMLKLPWKSSKNSSYFQYRKPTSYRIATKLSGYGLQSFTFVYDVRSYMTQPRFLKILLCYVRIWRWNRSIFNSAFHVFGHEIAHIYRFLFTKMNINI